ncbi:TPA: hypothetical protein ACH3X1_015452 [Trebouxia sp. C0004]
MQHEHRKAVEKQVSEGHPSFHRDVLRVVIEHELQGRMLSTSVHALIENFRASVQDVTEELLQFVREFAKLDSSPGEPFL